MTSAINASNLQLEFDQNQVRDLQSCIQHCNLQIKKAQRSWTKIVYDNKFTIGALLASSLITHFVLNRLLFMPMVFPFGVVPILYGVYKCFSLRIEAEDRFAKTQKVFCDVFSKYKGGKASFEEYKALNMEKSAYELVEECDNGLGSLTKIVLSQLMKAS